MSNNILKIQNDLFFLSQKKKTFLKIGMKNGASYQTTTLSHDQNKCLFNFQFFEANNISLESSTFADFKNHIFKTLVAKLQSF